MTVIVLLVVICLCMTAIPFKITHPDDSVTEYRNGWAWMNEQYHILRKTNIVEYYERNLHSYARLANGNYICDGNTYLYRLEFQKTNANDLAFVLLSNDDQLTIQDAIAASGLCSRFEFPS